MSPVTALPLNCRVEIPPVAGLPEQTLSVGREFYLVCVGDWPAQLNKDHLQIIVPETQKYSLKLLGFQQKDLKTADLKVVSYAVGPQQFQGLQLSDGAQVLPIANFEFQVTSVQDPNQPKQEPYGPLGPLNLNWPAVYWVILGTAISIFILSTLILVWRKMKRQRWLKQIKTYDHAQSPMTQFQSELRKLQRNSHFLTSDPKVEIAIEDKKVFLETINRLVRIFLIREFKINALEPSQRLLLNEFKKYHRSVYDEQMENLRQWLREIKKANQDLAGLKSKDLLQILLETRKLVESIDQTKTKLHSESL